MSRKNRAIDLTVGDPLKSIVKFAIPLLLGSVFNQLYNVVDTIIVGRFVSDRAFGAVGSTFPIVFIAISVGSGLAVGCSVIISQFVGAKRYKDVRTAMNTSLILTCIISVVMTALLELVATPLLRFVNTPEDTFAMAEGYLRWFFTGTFFMFEYNSVGGIFRALGDSKTPFYLLVLSSFLNIGLDILFVASFNMGCDGAAIATVISQAVCALLSTILLLKYMRRQYPTKEKGRAYDASMSKTVLRLGFPSMLQGFALAAAFILFQMLINSFGSITVSGYTAAIRVQNFAYIPLMDLANAHTTFVAQNYGARKPDRIKKGFKSTFIAEMVVAVAGGIIVYVFAHPLIALMIGDADPEIYRLGIYHLRKIAMILPVSALMYIYESYMRGLGEMNLVFGATLFGMVLRTVVSFLVIPNLGFPSVWWCEMLGDLGEALAIIIVYYARVKKRVDKYLTSPPETQEEAVKAQ
ncbi:MAG: MATE family efflux transporter [Oscillospiraceae bacterium]|jgi:putative MATE family efflux protein